MANNPNSEHWETKTSLFTSYTLPWYDKRFRFKMDSIYYKNSLQEKADAVRDLYDGNFTIIDTETNGKNLLWESLPFQFSGIKYRNWVEVERFSPFINIGKIPHEILELTHMEQSFIDWWLDELEGMVAILDFLRGEEIIFAHNAWFDIAILNNLFVKTGLIDDANLGLWDNLLIRDSMQYFYAIYKHMFWYGVTWSSMEFLTNHFFMIPRDADRAHQADYDCELLFEVISKMVKFFNSKYDELEEKIIADEKRKKYYDYVVKYYDDDWVINDMHRLWNEVVDHHDHYLYLKSKVDNIKTAVVDYLINLYGAEYVEAYFKPFYVKKNKPFETVQYAYLGSYQRDNVSFESEFWPVEFFFEVDKREFTTDLYISSESEMVSYLYEIDNLWTELANLQQTINNKLAILKAHNEVSKYKLYGGLEVHRGKTKSYLDRTPNVYAIEKDFKEWKIASMEDLLEYRDYNTNLTVQLEGEGVI